MDKLQMMKDWLAAFPGWGADGWDTDLTALTPVSCRLTLENDRVIHRTQDVMGNSALAMQAQFSLIRVSGWEENPGQWVEDFTQWVLCQSEQGLAPQFGKGITRICPEKGKLETAGGQAVYTVKLVGTYEKIFEVKNDGKNW